MASDSKKWKPLHSGNTQKGKDEADHMRTESETVDVCRRIQNRRYGAQDTGGGSQERLRLYKNIMSFM